MPPTYQGSETWIFKRALRVVSGTQKQIAVVYRQVQENILTQIAKYRLKGEVTGTVKEIRLRQLYNQIDNEIRKLGVQTRGYIRTGFGKNYNETYYQIAFINEREINIGKGFESLKADYSFNYTQLNPDAVRASFNKNIAGNTFKDRMIKEQTRLRFHIRQEVAGAVAEGISEKELSKRLLDVDKAFRSGKAKAQATARTELLRAQSYAQAEADDIAESAGANFTNEWSATFDDKTRAAHQAADGQKAQTDESGQKHYMVGGVKLIAPRIPAPDATGNIAGQVINCRCRDDAMPVGFRPTKRAVKLPNGKWVKVNGDMTYNQYKESLLKRGKKSVKRAYKVVGGEKYKEFVKTEFGYLNKKLNEAQKNAIQRYTGFGFSDINKRLREGLKDFYATDIMKSFKKTKGLSKNVQMFRGMSVNEKFLSNFKPGYVIKDKAFTSVSSDIRIARDYLKGEFKEKAERDVLIKINVPKGSKILYMNNPSSQEFLFNANSKFKIKSIGKGEVKTGTLEYAELPKKFTIIEVDYVE